MTENASPPLANFGDTSTLTAEQRTQASAALVKAGYDSAAVEKALSPATPALASEQQPAQAPQISLDAQKHPSLSDSEQQALADNLRKHWTGDPALLERELSGARAADGQGVTLSTDPRSADEIEYDKTFAGAAPDAYKMNWQNRIPEGLQREDIFALDGEIREALSAMNFSPRIGPAVMEQAFDDARVWSGYDETSRELYDRQQRVDLGRVIGDDKVDAALTNARVMLSLIKPALREELLNAGLFRSARTILQLHMQAERWLARADMAERPKRT